MKFSTIKNKLRTLTQLGTLAMVGLLSGVNPAQAGATDGCTPVVLTRQTPNTNICYGTASWLEPTLHNTRLTQTFDLYRAVSTKPTPLIIWAHQSGNSKALPKDSDPYNALVVPALAAGFSFASLEFRHPNTNQMEAATNNGVVPSLDIAHALQYIRANAKALNIDPANVFFVGASRGTLTLWTALQNDMANPFSPDPVARQSTRVNAVFGYNAQTTYDGREFANLFLVPEDRQPYIDQFIADNPYYEQFGSSIQSVNAGRLPDPPVMLRYNTVAVPRLLTYEEMLQQNYVHYPNFGMVLCSTYFNKFGDNSHCSFEGDPKFNDMQVRFAGYVDFFKLHLKPTP